MDTEARYPIRVVANRAGLTPHVIRIWERRYGAVTPQRTDTQRRLYSDADIERLSLLRRATEAGHSIGRIANAPNAQLEELIRADALTAVATAHRDGGSRLVPAAWVTTPDAALQAGLDATRSLDSWKLEAILNQAAVTHSQPILMEKIIVPLLNVIGDEWREGLLRPTHEHLASAVIRSFLATIGGAYAVHEAAPILIVTTPIGQLHEIGAMLVTATAAAEGWRVTYLGPNLPAEEVVAAAIQTRARAVALSVVYPTDDTRVADELRKIRQQLPESTLLLVGGRAAVGYAAVLKDIGAVHIENLPALRNALEAIRYRPAA